MPKRAVDFIKKYHGYYVAWALIYTLWFHPMTGTFGHLAGFIYMFLLLGQGTLMFTRLHNSLKWSAVLEGLVLVHGTTVALIGQQSPLWTMFFSGFGFMFIAAQLWGIQAPKPVNIAAVVVYVISVLTLYSGVLSPLGPIFSQSLPQIHQMFWIPFTLYALVPVFLLLAALLARAKSIIATKKAAGPQ
jgi:NADH:ubiquinone oxidoreductase subunit 6 (subunit J)